MEPHIFTSTLQGRNGKFGMKGLWSGADLCGSSLGKSFGFGQISEWIVGIRNKSHFQYKAFANGQLLIPPDQNWYSSPVGFFSSSEAYAHQSWNFTELEGMWIVGDMSKSCDDECQPMSMHCSDQALYSHRLQARGDRLAAFIIGSIGVSWQNIVQQRIVQIKHLGHRNACSNSKGWQLLFLTNYSNCYRFSMQGVAECTAESSLGMLWLAFAHDVESVHGQPK